jgi:AmmeMemoRadiSam system protein B/AmmeMemoRadiSam system protein A
MRAIIFNCGVIRFIAMLGLILFSGSVCFVTVYGKEIESQKSKEVQKMLTNAIVGKWYSADTKTLLREIEGLFAKGKVKQKENVIGLILPHAGYQYSGATAALGLKTLKKKYKRIIVIGPSHYVGMQGILSVPDADSYQTPLGEIELDTEFIRKLLKEDMFRYAPAAHEHEHSVQIEVPLLQYVQEDFKFVPIVAGQCSAAEVKEAAGILHKMVDNETLVVASSDFVHYGARFGYVPFTKDIPEGLRKVDMGAYEYIAKLDGEGFLKYKQKTGATICGCVPVAILVSMCDKDTKVELVKYTTSGEMTGDFDNSVSYMTVALCGSWSSEKNAETKEEAEEGLSGSDKESLLKLARASLIFYLEKNRAPEPIEVGVEISEKMSQKRAAFVTLKKKGLLRGCIGDLFPRQALYESVIGNAINAGVRDHRFPPVTRNEVDELTIEISALTVPQAVGGPEDIRIGIDGVILGKGGRRAVFLPQVAPEQGWAVEEMLKHLSMKAGLPADAWKEGAEFFTFQAEVFGEQEE